MVKKMRGYSLININDGLAYDFIIANNIKEAKRLMIEYCSEWINEYDNPILEFYAKWNKKANIEGLKLYEHVEGNNLLRRNICTSLEYGECEECKQDDVSVDYFDEIDKVLCTKCEDNLE